MHIHTHTNAHAHTHKPQYVVECIFFNFFSHIHTTHNFVFFARAERWGRKNRKGEDQ